MMQLVVVSAKRMLQLMFGFNAVGVLVLISLCWSGGCAPDRALRNDGSAGHRVVGEERARSWQRSFLLRDNNPWPRDGAQLAAARAASLHLYERGIGEEKQKPDSNMSC